MKTIIKAIIFNVLILGGVFHSGLTEGNNEMKNHSNMYMAQLRAKGIQCVMFINGIHLGHTFAYHPETEMSKSDRIGAVLSEGNNTIGLHVIDSSLMKADAFCELVIIRSLYDDNDDLQSTDEVTSIRVTLDENGQFTTKESKKYANSNLTGNVTFKKLDTAYYEEDYLLKDAIATRSLVVDHPHRYFSWAYRATSVENNERTFQLAWDKYMEIRQAFGNKDKKKLIELYAPGLTTETEIYQGDPETQSWTNSILAINEESWMAEDFKLLEENPKDYTLQVEAGGRLFRLNYDNTLKRSTPISYIVNGNKRGLNITLTLVDGQVVVAF